MSVLAPKIAGRLKPGGYWSLVGGTKAAYPALQAKGDSQILRWLSGVGSRKWMTPCSIRRTCEEVADTMDAHGFDGRRRRNVRTVLEFNAFDQFMEFGYRGGWLTPLIESMGLHRAGPISAGCSTGSPSRSRIRTTS